MQYLRTCLLISCLVLLGISLVPNAQADEFKKKTEITFTEAVELPGVILPPGTYVFKIVNPVLDRNVVRVLSADESKLFATILAIPAYRMRSTDNTEFTFETRAEGAPKAIKEWFYPGETYGQEFVYPKPKASELARTNQQQAPEMPAEFTTEMTEPTEHPEVQAEQYEPVASVQPSGEEARVEDYPAEAAEAQVPEAQQSTAVQSPTNTMLPKTASPLFLIGLAGIVSIAGAFAIRLFSRT